MPDAAVAAVAAPVSVITENVVGTVTMEFPGFVGVLAEAVPVSLLEVAVGITAVVTDKLPDVSVKSCIMPQRTED